jgi:predicted NACHT family NTPase
MFDIDKISTEVLSTIIASSTQVLGSKVIAQFKQGKETTKELKDYLLRLTNRVSYFVTYRPNPQHVDDAYVAPLILNSALSKTYIPPETYEKMATLLEEGLAKGLTTEQLSTFVASGLSHSDNIVVNVQYIPLDELTNNYHSILVLGEAGAGKSALLSYLCLSRLRHKKPRLPVFADARDLDKKNIGVLIKDLLTALNLNDKDLKWLDKSLTIYIDGLDELENKRFKQICAEIGVLRSEYPNIELTVSCRSASYKGELSFLDEISLLPFDVVRAESFIERWFKTAHNAPPHDKLINQIRKSEKLSDLSTQPLLLALMCNAYCRYLNISRRHTTLFDQCIESLLWQWDADRAISRESAFSSLDLEKKKWLHSSLATNLHLKKKRFFEKRFLLSILEEDLPKFGINSSEASNVLTELCSKHGILVEWTQDTYGFGHFALQEYLTAKWYASEQRWRSLITKEVLSDSWWENTLALCFAILSDATIAMKTLLEFEHMAEIEKLRILSNSLKYDPLISPDIRSRILNRILHYYHNGNAQQHDIAVDMLIGIDDDWSAPLIVKSLDSPLPSRELAKALKWID